ncbi:MAG: hypothetical protein QOF37_3127, partial [Thermoleophilaceae bacterium]|nr:hypothetical protein [Thermoleophilaceae bacterium]
WVEGFATVLFLAVVAAIAAATHAGPPLRLWVVGLVFVVGMGCVRAQLPVASGFTTPMAVVDVAALFLLPPAAVPLTIAAVYLASRALDASSGKLAPGRIWLGIPHATTTLGPALVFALAAPGPPDGHDWPVYLLALAAQFACDFGAGAGREIVYDGCRPLEFLRETAWVYVLDLALCAVGFAFALGSSDRPWAVLLILPLGALMTAFARERRAGIDRLLELSSAYRGTAMVLGNVIEEDDGYTGLHSQGVVMLALAVADALGLDAPVRQRVEFGALLHDVGKIAIPKSIINKPGSLDDSEWALMKTHTVEGQRMLEQVGGLMGEVGRVVRASHERWDGHGYPDGLMGEEIPLEARIVCCADAFSAMTTDRPYSAARPVADALDELRRCAGTQFDPQVVATLVAHLERAGGVDRSSAALLPDPGAHLGSVAR